MTTKPPHNLEAARLLYAGASCPEDYTAIAARWLRANPGRRKLPSSHHAVLRELGLKRCPGCETVKPTADFSRRTSGRGGLESHCRACRAGTAKAYAAKDPEAAKARSRESSARYRKAHPWAVKLYDGYERARRMGAPAVKVSEEELLASWASRGIDPGRSHYSGELLTDENRSLDHFDPLGRPGTLGHCAANLFPCTVKENTHHKRGLFPARGLRAIAEAKETAQ